MCCLKGNTQQIKFGLDDGVSFLKMNFVVLNTSNEIDETPSRRQKIPKILQTSTAQDTGVNHQLIIAVTEEQ